MGDNAHRTLRAGLSGEMLKGVSLFSFFNCLALFV
uniref:Uncharacterized protein n=1 Tax=Anguilla anguilla TaxID=7936 RepID=A0A0E9XCE9_ANGAN